MKKRELKNSFLIEGANTENDAFIVSGYFKRFDKTNENGERYTRDAYDKFINHYYVQNKLHVPVDVMHKDDIYHLAGKVVKMEKDNKGIKINVELSKNAVNYDAIKGLIEDGVLQGFSDFGFATDFSVEKDEKGLPKFILIKEAILMAISLVAMPAETGAKLFQNETKFIGFEEPAKKLPFLKTNI